MPIAPDTGKKEKKTRRRLRLSCVECTKRRQRCDRVYPCGLCVSRGVSHLCRWENVPVARPTPARPPVVPTPGTSDASIQQLSARIASLEQTVVAERLRNRPRSDNHLDTLSGSSPHSSSRGLSLPNDYSPHHSVVSLQSPSSGNSPYSSPEPYSQEDENEHLAATPLADSVYNAVSTLAQQSLGHHGEYIGKGSSLSALYSISTKTAPRLPHVSSTEASVLFQSISPNEQTCPSILRLIQSLPSNTTVAALCQVFFKDANWRFGIPEAWFHATCADMWNAMRYTAPQVQINPNWLSLVYAVLAIVHRSGLQSISNLNDMESPEQYFSYAMTARRIAESAYLVRPSATRASAAQGSVLACLAVPLLCDYLAERGRVSEAWKLVGNAILCAEAVGMHRDPSWREWQKISEDIMSDEEKLLRRRAWWGLFIWERMYALVLGRPTVIRSHVSDVVVPAPINADGTRNFFNVYQGLFIQLVHLAGETVEKCFGVGAPASTVVHEIDRKFEHWENQLPPEFRSDIRSEFQSIPDDLDTSDLVALARQRYTLSTWYLLCRSKLHLSFVTSQDDPMFLEVWGHPLTRKRSRNRCISFASDLIRLQLDAHINATRCRNEQVGHESVLMGSNWCFGGCYSLFEGAVTLASLLPQHSWQGRSGDPDSLIHQAMLVLIQVGNEEHGTGTGAIARMGSEALAALIQELGARNNNENVLHTTPTTTFNSYNPPTPFMGTPTYEWYTSDGAFGLPGEYTTQPSEGKEVPRYNMELQLPMLMSYEESKVGLMYESAARA
ncbi:hypothetical protein C8R43DRAFT_896857 [Mycena crocata]|nr:hypothetical protein C8R43DRAFT_896857 [Mycena crocata]